MRPSMPGFGVKEENSCKKYIIAAIITTTNLLANSNIHIFSKQNSQDRKN